MAIGYLAGAAGAAYTAGQLAIGYQLMKNARKRALSAVAERAPKRIKLENKPRSGRSRTETITKRKKTPKGKTIYNAPLYQSANTVVYKMPKAAKHIKERSNTVTYEQSVTWGNTTTQGVQNVNVAYGGTSGFCGNSTLLDLYQRGAKFYNTTTSTYVTQVGTTSSAQFNKFFLKSVYCTLRLTNQSPASCEVDLYLVQQKISKATYKDSVTDWEEGLDGEQLGNALTRTFYNSRPTQSKQFNMAWRVVKVLKLKLNPGDEHRHLYTFKPNRIIDTGYLNNYSTLAGMTHEWITVVRGITADTSNDPAVGSITTTPAKIVGTVNALYKGYIINSTPKAGYQTTTITTGNANVYTIADAAGTVTNNMTATNFA